MMKTSGCQTANMPHSVTQTIEIVLNGDRKEIPGGLDVLGLLQHLEIDPARVAVELNRAIVRQPDWALSQVENGAQVEIVQFVGGG
jgi:thiamine biosynthesis protein ThiS